MEKMDIFYSDVKAEKLDNGLKVIYKYFPSEIIGVSIFIGTGSGDEGKFIGSGISHLTEHLVFEGRKDLEEELRKLGAISNAYTTFDHTLYHMELPKENLKKALEVFLTSIFAPVISEDIFQRERMVVLKEEKFRDDDPGSLLIKLGFEKTYINHPYKYPILGEAELLKNLKLTDLEEFHKTNYVANNMVVSVSGDIDYNEFKKSLLSLTSSYKPASILKGSFPKEKKNFSSYYQREYPGELVYSFISFSGVSIFDQDLEVLDLLSDYLSYGKDAPLYKRFVETGICYSLSFLNYTPHSQGLYGFVAVLEEDNLSKYKSELKKFAVQIKEEKIDFARIERLKKKAAYDYLKIQESPLRIAQTLSRNEGLTDNYRFSMEYLNKFMDINEADFKAAILNYLNLNSSTETVLLPEKEEASLKRPLELKQEFKDFTYPNGLKVVVAKRNISPLTAISVLFNGGVRVEDEKTNGISQVLPQVLITADIEKRFEELGGKIKPISGNNSIGFEVQVIEKDFYNALALISSLIKKPNFKDAELKIHKNIQLGKIKDSEIDLFFQGFKLVRESAYKKHPYRLMPQGSIESVAGLNIEDLNNFYSQFCVPNNCVIAISGDVDFEKVNSDIKKLFSSWDKSDLLISPERDSYPDREIKANKIIAQNEVVLMLGFMVPEINSEIRYQLDIVQALVSGQGSVFFNKIRKEIAAAYALGGSLFLGPEPGVMVFYVATTPDKKDEVLDKMKFLLDFLKEGNITDEEINNSKAMLKTQYFKDITTNSSLAFRIAVNEVIGLGYDEIKRYLGAIEKVSREDIVKFLNDYIDLNKAIIIEVGNLNNN